MKNGGFTLVELVLAIAFLGITLPALLNLFADTTVTSAESQVLPLATDLASEVMEEIKAAKFDELTAKDANGNWSTTMGPDAGETAGVSSTFDDVDDFNGWTKSFSGAFSGYSASVTVSYVASDALGTALTIPSPVPNNWTSSYKYIVVTLSNPGLSADLTLATVVTEVQSL